MVKKRKPRTSTRVFSKQKFKTFNGKLLRLSSIHKSKKLAKEKREKINTPVRRLEKSRIIKTKRGFELFTRFK